MDSPPSLEAFAKLQIPALRHDAACLDAWVHRHDSGVDVQAIAERILRLHETIRERGWMPVTHGIERGLEVLREGLQREEPDQRRIALLTRLLVARTRAMLGDDPGPEPHGGPLAAQMALGAKRRA